MYQQSKNLQTYKIRTPFLQELIWFHRIKLDQDKEMLALEFLNICASHYKENQLFNLDEVKYNKDIELRTILYNFPELDTIYKLNLSDEEKWDKIFETLNQKFPSDFTYLKNRFENLETFYKVVEMLRNASIGLENNRRWSSKFLFPFSFNTLFADMGDKRYDIDRRFFSRGGEILYLMISRGKNSQKLKNLLIKTYTSNENKRWDNIINLFRNQKFESENNKMGFLRYETHEVFDSLVDDLIKLFELNLAVNDIFKHLSNISAYYLVHFILKVANDEVFYPVEILDKTSNQVRKVSREIYKINEESILEKLNQEIDNYFINIPSKDKLKEELNFESETNDLKKELKVKVLQKAKTELIPVHRELFKNCGLASRVKTNSYRYLLSDEFIKLLVLINVENKMDFNQFLELLYKKYKILISNKNRKNEENSNDFKKNEKRFFMRLKALGLLENKSDGYSYVVNMYRGK